HRLTCFNTGKEALDAIHPLSEFDFLVSDYYLPDLNGVEVIRRAREVKPSIPAMLLTGSREPEIAQAALRIPNVMVRYKPFGLEDFERCLGEVAGL
ncbi:response regulator, partial [Salmonella enterica]